jgi:protocatechuate 3,4-dioxygenase beta subunit
MKLFLIPLIALLIFTSSCGSQDKENTNTDKSAGKKIIVGDGCEGCEAVFETPIPFEKLRWSDTLPDFNETGPQLEISGVIYKPDGVTPAPEVVLYVYHTDQKGYYSQKGGETGWGKRHGYIREWLKTNDKGEYKFYTLRPAHYPSNDAPAHIHAIIKEPDKNEYWLDDYVFEDDKLVDEDFKKMIQLRGGSGIISLTKNENGMLIGKRDIILGKNIPNYPK